MLGYVTLDLVRMWYYLRFIRPYRLESQRRGMDEDEEGSSDGDYTKMR